MAIVVSQSPADLSFSRNPVVYVFDTPDVLITTGSEAINLIAFTGTVADGTEISLRWRGQDQRLTAKTVPDSSGTTFPAGDGSGTYVTSLVNHFRANFLISEDFSVDTYELPGGVHALRFTALKVGKAYTFSNTTFTGGYSDTFSPGLDDVIRENFHLYCEVCMQSSSDTTFLRVWNSFLDIDADYQIQFDVSDILHAHLEADLPTDGVVAFQHRRSHRRYYLRVAEAFGQPLSIGQLTQLSTKAILAGGTPYAKGPGIRPQDVTWGATIDLDKAHRIEYGARKIRYDEPAYLTFSFTRPAIPADIALMVEIHKGDNVILTLTNQSPLTGLEPYDVATWDVSVAALGLVAAAGAAGIKSYRVRLMSGEADWSLWYVYQLDPTHKPYTRYFVYQNSRGGIDVLKTYGRGSVELEFFREAADKVTPYNYSPRTGESEEYDLRLREKFEVATGFQSVQQLRLILADFFRSKYKYRYLPGTELRPVAVSSKNMLLGTDGDNHHAAKFEYQHRFQDDTITEDDIGIFLSPPGTAGGEIYYGATEPHTEETDPTVGAWIKAITALDIQQWDAAYSWGNHAGAGYLLAADASNIYATNERVDDLEQQIDAIAEELTDLMATPADSTLWERVGATDEETGLYRLPTIATNEYGVVVDKDDNTLETVWFKVRGEVADLANLLLLMPTNPISALPLAAQNGMAGWWTAQVETLTNAPIGLTGLADISVGTLGRNCKVTIKNNGGEVYNYTHDFTVVGPTLWSGWKFVPHLTQLAEANKLLKATGQTLAQAEIWANEDGTFSIGEQRKFTSAMLSVLGRMGLLDPLFEDDAVTLRYLNYAVSALVSQADFQLIYTNLLALIADRANRVHGHTISDITSLAGELEAKLNKNALGSGKPYFVLGRDPNGNPTMIDNKGAALNGQYLPDAIEGIAYSQTLPVALFVWPDGVYQKDVVLLSDKAWVRSGMSFDYITGLTISGTPPDNENPHIAIKMKWKFSAGDEWKEQEFTIFLNVEPAGTSTSVPTAPSGLGATALGTNSIQLVWTDNSSNETGYKIYRGTASGSYLLIATVGPNIVTYLDSGLAANTTYYYQVQAYNTAGSAVSNEVNALTESTPTDTYINEVVAGSSRVRKFGVVIEPPATNNPRPVGIKFGFQPARYVETKHVIWQHKTTGERRTFLEFDQNNKPNRELPDSNWKVAEVTETESFIKRTADAGANILDVWFRTPMLQVSEQTYYFEIIGRLMDYAASYGVYLSIGFRQDIGNGGIPGRLGLDYSAPWRFLLEDCAKAQQFNDETGEGTKTVYTKELSPCLFSERFYNNTLTFYTAYANYWKNHPYKAYAPSVHPLYSNTGESHFNINEDRYMDACPTTMSAFWVYLMNTVSESKRNSLFSEFLADYTNESSPTARAFLRGYSGNEAKAIWQYFLQDYYFGATTDELYNTPHPTYFRLYAKLGAIVKAAGLRWKCDHGSFLDFSVPRQNMYALDPKNTAQWDVLKQNPMGWRVGYPEVAALKASGKLVALEWTPGAIGSGEDFGDIATSVSTITTACMDAWDAGVDEMVLAFVINNDYYNTVAIPIINALKAAGYWALPKQNFTPSNLIDVDLYQQMAVGNWYYNDSDGTPEFNEPIHRMTTGVTGESGGKTRANIQKYGYRILPSNDPRL